MSEERINQIYDEIIATSQNMIANNKVIRASLERSTEEKYSEQHASLNRIDAELHDLIAYLNTEKQTPNNSSNQSKIGEDE